MNARKFTATRQSKQTLAKPQRNPLRVLSPTQHKKAQVVRKEWMRFTGTVHLRMFDKI